jgi:hypothetical protein
MKKTLTVIAAITLVAAMAAGGEMSQTGAAKGAAKAPTTREMALLCWQEFGELVPAKIDTVLVPFGSLEPHGVIPNGTDSLAPEAMARDIAARVDALIAPVLNYGMTDAMPSTRPRPGWPTPAESGSSSSTGGPLPTISPNPFSSRTADTPATTRRPTSRPSCPITSTPSGTSPRWPRPSRRPGLTPPCR